MKKYLKKCDYCGEDFGTNYPGQKYCSDTHRQYSNQGRVMPSKDQAEKDKQEAYEIARAAIEQVPIHEREAIEIELINKLTDNGAEIIKFWYDIKNNCLVVGDEKMKVTVAQMMTANDKLEIRLWGKPKQISVATGKTSGGDTNVNLIMYDKARTAVEGEIVDNLDISRGELPNSSN